MDNYISGMNFDIGQTKNVADLLYKSVVESGKEEGQELANNLQEGLKEAGEGKKLAEALGMIDIENIDSIRKLSEYLDELGYSGTKIDIGTLEE